MKRQLFINDADADRCKESFRRRKPIHISGVDVVDGQIRQFSGVVLSVAYISSGEPAKRWEITVDTD